MCQHDDDLRRMESFFGIDLFLLLVDFGESVKRSALTGKRVTDTWRTQETGVPDSEDHWQSPE